MKIILRVVACAIVLDLSSLHLVTAAEAEGTIAINPTDHNNLVAAIISLGAINSIRVQYSFNGGAGWTDYGIISGSVTAGDPVVAFDPDGVAYIVYQHFFLADLVIHRSTDGGITWSNGTTISFAYPDEKIDRPWMAVSPLRNVNGKYDIYIAHVWEGTLLESEEGESHIIRLAKSTDGGETFTYPGEGLMSPLLDERWPQGPSIGVGPSGNIYRSWASYDPGDHNAVKEIHIDRSTNGGSSFANRHSVSTVQIGFFEESNYFIKQGWVRVDSYPHLAVDPISEAVYVMWAGKQSSANILMLKSTNLGVTWSNLMTVDQSGGEQWMPAVSVSPDQVLCVLFYSTLDTQSDPIFIKFARSTDGGGSFTTNTVGSGFVIPTETFLGDYQGLTSKLDAAFAYYTRGSSPSDAFSSQSIPSLNPANHSKVVVDQLDEGGQSFEKFGRWNQGEFTNYKPPITFVFPHTSNEVLRAKQDFKTGTTQKYNQWETLEDAANHRPFVIAPAQEPIRARFKTANTATVRTELMDGGSGDSVVFQDPWLIDYDDPPYGLRNQGMAAPFLPKLSPFSLSTGGSHKGVFVDQTIAGGKYYSLRAALTKPISSFTWFFQEWSGSGVSFVQTVPNPPGFDQKAVIFTANGAEAIARYKAHLGSSLIATSTNSQRKLAVDENGAYYLAYESAGEVWFTESMDGGATWSPEVRISNGASSVGSPSGAPSIAAGFAGILPLTSLAPEVYIVYRQRISPTVPFFNIFLRYRRNGSWSTVQINNPTYGVDLGRDPHPVIVTNVDEDLEPYEMYVVWRGGNSGNDYQLHYSYLTSSTGNWEVVTQGEVIPNTTLNHLNPSLSSPFIDGFTQRPTFFSYDNGLDVLLQRCVPVMNSAAQYIWQAFGSFSGNSQVAADVRSAEPSEHQVHVVWENVSAVGGGGEETQGNATEQRSVMHRRTVGGTLDWATEFRSYDPGENYSHPTIALLEDGTARWA